MTLMFAEMDPIGGLFIVVFLVFAVLCGIGMILDHFKKSQQGQGGRGGHGGRSAADEIKRKEEVIKNLKRQRDQNKNGKGRR
jgi:hypothetical protein